MGKQEGFIFRINKDAEGEKLLSDIKNTLNKDSYNLKVRFTGKRDTAYSGHTRKEDATSYRVYINAKRKDSPTPFDYIQRGREIERGENAFKNARADVLMKNLVNYEVEEKPTKVELNNPNKQLYTIISNLRETQEELVKANKLLKAKLILLNAGLKDSQKYGHFVQTINQLSDEKLSQILDKS